MTVHASDATTTGRTRPQALGWPEILAGGAAYAASFALVAVSLPLVDAMAGVGG